MTMIYSFNGDAFFAVSDIVMSSPEGSGDNAVLLPLHMNAVKHRIDGYSISGISQKSIIAENTLIMWAGSKIVAKVIIDDIIRIGNNGRDIVDLDKITRDLGLIDDEVESVSLIYHYHRDGYAIFRSDLNCSIRDDGTICAGTGSFDFLDNMTPGDALEIDHKSAHEIELNSILSRIFLSLSEEILERRTLNSTYGGWFELVTLSKGGFRKVPICLKLWQAQGRNLQSGLPCVFSWYEGHVLYIGRFIVTDPVEKSQFFAMSVRDFLGREPVKDDFQMSDFVWEPEIKGHALITERKTLTIMTTDGKSGSFDVNFTDGHVSVEMSWDFANTLLGMNVGDVPFNAITRPYD